MYSKNVFDVLKRFCAYLLVMLRMSNRSEENKKLKIYTFKPFKFEEIKPNKIKGRVPCARSGHRLGADSSNIYSFGGYNPLNFSSGDPNDEYWVQTFPLFQELWKFNFATKEWTNYPNNQTLPLELASNALLLQHNMLMVYGGTGSPFGFRCSNQLYVCRVTDGQGIMEEVHTTGQLPIPSYGQALVYHNDYLYTIGGTTGDYYTCDIHRLNLKTLKWEIVYICNGQGEYEPKGRYRHEVGFDKKNIYVLGGGTAFDACDFEWVPVFNLAACLWYPQKTLRAGSKGIPKPRRCHGAVQISTDTGAQVFIVGGHNGFDSFDDLWKLDLNTFQWTYFETCRLPRPTYFHAAAASPEGRLYIFGGICTQDEDVRRNNSIYSTWLCVPKLSEMCWEALLHYSPQIAKSSPAQLIDIGLPRRFIKRLGD